MTRHDDITGAPVAVRIVDGDDDVGSEVLLAFADRLTEGREDASLPARDDDAQIRVLLAENGTDDDGRPFLQPRRAESVQVARIGDDDTDVDVGQRSQRVAVRDPTR